MSIRKNRTGWQDVSNGIEKDEKEKCKIWIRLQMK
jgi:hypothetical protein